MPHFPFFPSFLCVFCCVSFFFCLFRLGMWVCAYVCMFVTEKSTCLQNYQTLKKEVTKNFKGIS